MDHVPTLDMVMRATERKKKKKDSETALQSHDSKHYESLQFHPSSLYKIHNAKPNKTKRDEKEKKKKKKRQE